MAEKHPALAYACPKCGAPRHEHRVSPHAERLAKIPSNPALAELEAARLELEAWARALPKSRDDNPVARVNILAKIDAAREKLKGAKP